MTQMCVLRIAGLVLRSKYQLFAAQPICLREARPATFCCQFRRGKNSALPSLRGCFLRLVYLPAFLLDQLSRYAATLMRQVSQVLFALDSPRTP
jgi:hypothetical protein